MKNEIGILLILGLFISSCTGNNDKITGSSTLTDEIAGKYTRSSKEDFGSYYNSIKDTIDILKKDGNFEVQNHRWFISSNDTADGYSRTRGFGTFQSKYNKIDTSIANPLGGSLRFDMKAHTVYQVEKPEVRYSKVK